jgi:Uma2 family endonuclease
MRDFCYTFAVDAPYPQRGHRYTLEEYLRLEELSSEKHEFHGGFVFATPPVYPDRPDAHDRIVRNTRTAMMARLDQRFRLVGGESMPALSAPDLAIVTVEREQPVLIFEVLSAATELVDRVEKFDRLRSVPSFREYALISQTHHHLTQFNRLPSGQWALRDFAKTDDIVHLESVGVDLPLREVFAGVTFLTLEEVLKLPEQPEWND